MIVDTALSRIPALAVHYIGNKTQDAELKLSNELSGMDGETENLLCKHVAAAFKTPDFFRFELEAEDQAVFELVKEIFHDQEQLLANSRLLAERLFHSMGQPNIRSGELLIFKMENVKVGNESRPALAIFKSERKQPFLFSEESEGKLELFSFKGIDPSKVDKACLILNKDAEDGYQILALDAINKSEEARYWISDFLQLQRRSTEFSKTRKILEITKEFIETESEAEEAPLPKLESAGMMNRSMAYFSESDEFTYDKFSEVVFGDASAGSRFREFAQKSEPNDLLLDDNFAISQEAVKKNKKFFKHVLKLDKNFHVYIHGNSDLIERGTDPETGKKFYKLYFEEES